LNWKHNPIFKIQIRGIENMRRGVSRFAVLLGIMCAGSALAATTVDTAKGQVLLELQATGRVTQLADVVEVSCSISARAVSKTLAVSAMLQKRAKLANAVKSAGFDATALRFDAEPQVNRYSIYDEEDDEDGDVNSVVSAAKEAAGSAAQSPVVRKLSYSQLATLKLPRLSQTAAAENAMAEAGCKNATLSRLSINDRDTAARNAKNKALVEARKQADAYAASLNLKVLRVARVSEYSPISALIGADASEMAMSAGAALGAYRESPLRLLLDNGGDPDAFVTTKTIWVDFVLAPN
jgi:uncharacterized protein YggE